MARGAHTLVAAEFPYEMRPSGLRGQAAVRRLPTLNFRVRRLISEYIGVAVEDVCLLAEVLTAIFEEGVSA